MSLKSDYEVPPEMLEMTNDLTEAMHQCALTLSIPEVKKAIASMPDAAGFVFQTQRGPYFVVVMTNMEQAEDYAARYELLIIGFIRELNPDDF